MLKVYGSCFVPVNVEAFESISSGWTDHIGQRLGRIQIAGFRT